MRENFLEEAFLLQYHLKMQYGDIRTLPLPYRRWFIERLSSEFKKQAEAQKKASDDSQNIVDVPMGEIYQQFGLDAGDAPAQSNTQQSARPARGRTLKFGSE